MRLLNVHTYTFEEFFDAAIPKYFIASHRWGPDEIVYNSFHGCFMGRCTSYRENRAKCLQDHRRSNTQSYQKLKGFCDVISSRNPEIGYLWIDTICINKDSSQELQEAISSMFQYYQRAEACYVYLHDSASMSGSLWWTRGWTLQELLAPQHVIFFSKYWTPLCSKAQTVSEIHAKTGIPEDVLRDVGYSRLLSIDHRMAWIRQRETTKPEDKAYSMLGIFGVRMTVDYGEGYERAYNRLIKAIGESSSITLQSAGRSGTSTASSYSPSRSPAVPAPVRSTETVRAQPASSLRPNIDIQSAASTTSSFPYTASTG